MAADTKKIRLCIISLGAYPLLAGKDIDFVGGAELQSSLLARELAKRDFEVSLIVLDHGQPSPQTIDGIRVLKAYPAATPMGIGFSTVLALWKALAQADADVYYGFRGAAGIMALYCLLKRRKLVIGIPSDMEVAAERAGRLSLNNWLWRFDLRTAARVVAQTTYQQEMLRTHFRRESTLINAYHPVGDAYDDKVQPPVVLWVSTIRPQWKQPELFLRLAEAIPEATFRMIGGPSKDEAFYERIREQASRIANLDFVGFVPHSEVGRHFEEASVFVNTSEIEGFPNTFLEAWARYTPVVSLNVDPDEIICDHDLGFHSRTFEQMVEDVRSLLQDGDLRKEIGKRGRRFVESEYDLNVIADQFAELFTSLGGEHG